MYRILITKTFVLEISKNLNKIDFIKFNKFKNRLKLNPFLGDIVRVYYVREFRLIAGKRLYFVIYSQRV